jgi:poly-gamma-glutamate synthesis protein (capsule biosynthesis protein)
MPSKYLKFILPLLFALAIALGLMQRQEQTYIIDHSNAKTIALSQAAESELWAFYNKGQTLVQDKPIEKTQTTFLAVGDIMLSRKVALKIKQANNPLLPFSRLSPLLNSTDFNFGNLETPLAEKPIIGGSSLIFASPTSSLNGLMENQFKILNLANNHALDKGLDRLLFTKQLLTQNNILTVGAGRDLNQAWQPAVVKTNGIKVCFVGASYASINDNGKTSNDYVARIEDTQNLKLSINTSKTICDYIVATMHAGTEYTRKPNQAQIDFAHKAIDLGADMVIGAHPHWVQTIERYAPNCPSPIPKEGAPSASEGRERLKCGEPKYIFYSLGNFIFDQDWSQETKEGLTLKIQISKIKNQNELQGTKTPASLDSLELLPVIIENFSTPRLANEIEAKKILEKIGVISPFLPLSGGGEEGVK